MRKTTFGARWRTIRHLRPSQLAYLMERRLWRRTVRPRVASGPVMLAEASPSLIFPEWQPDRSREVLVRHEFSFLNSRASCNGSIPWTDSAHSRLWLYHLNYCDFLNIRLSLPHESSLLVAACGLMRDWCERNPSGREIGWEPYPLSLRIVNWLKFMIQNSPGLHAMGEGNGIRPILNALASQTTTLEARLEKDLLANHFLKNIKALLFAGALLQTSASDRWWRAGENLLHQELQEQILADGGHYERSPMYHVQVLEDLLDIKTLCEGANRPLICMPFLQEKIVSMRGFLYSILQPDGEIPLFNDSALNSARPAKEVLEMAGVAVEASVADRPEVTVLAESGYGVIRDRAGKSLLILDCGTLGPEYQPGHGHCDVLSYELSLGGERVVVDTGVSTYEEGPQRLYERSTAAHNTVRVDGEEQAEIWASFRVGRRPQVGSLEKGIANGVRFMRGSHYGFKRLGVVHSRTIAHTPSGCWLVVDTLTGTGCHRMESFVHFHPRVQVELLGTESSTDGCGTRSRYVIRLGEQRYHLLVSGKGEVTEWQSWCSPEFGCRQARSTLQWVLEEALPAHVFHAFLPLNTEPPSLRFVQNGTAFEIDHATIPLM